MMYKILVAALAVLSTTNAYFVNDPDPEYLCDYKYIDEAEGWFKIHLEATTWSQAGRICEQEGAVLASPDVNPIHEAMLALMNISRYGRVHDDSYRPHVIHTAKQSTETDLSGGEPKVLGLTDTDNLVRVSRDMSLPYICFKEGAERPQLNSNMNECGPIDSGYTSDSRTKHCYKFHRIRRNWFEADATCTSDGGHLAIINSEVEAQVIRDIFANNPASTIPGHVDFRDIAFVGIKADLQPKWITVQGQTLAAAGYEVWAPGEPNNAKGNEFCGSVQRDGKLFDDPCTGHQLPYICEKEANSCGPIDNGYALDHRTQHCYKFHRIRRTWVDAETTCVSEGGHLAIINSKVEAQVIRDIFSDNPESMIGGHPDFRNNAFIGFKTNKWMTVQGKPLSSVGYEVWAPGEPNNANQNEFCVSVRRDGKYFDDPCQRELPYICEKEMANLCKTPTT